MNRIRQTLALFLCAVATMSTAQNHPESPILAPYFHIPGTDESADLMPIKSISAKVSIAGMIADVTLTQTFVNLGNQSIEATYVFPGSTKAAVYSMEMNIGERKIKAEIAERKRAREKYKRAKRNGQRSSLLEQNRPNVFQMSVANIMPGDTIQTTLSYTELLSPEDGKYEFVLPTTVGPRYSTQTLANASPGDKWVSNPYLTQSVAPNYLIDINVTLSAPVPIQEVRSASHPVKVDFTSARNCQLALTPSAQYQGDRDFVLEYFLQGKHVETGILTYKDGDENFFMMTVEPPQNVTPEQIPPREYVFVVDVSGSMHGFPLNVAKRVMKNLLPSLQPQDRFNVVLFEFGSQKLFPQPVPANESNVSKALSLLGSSSGGGGTNLYEALEGVILEEPSTPFARSVVVITDGFIHAEREVFELIRGNLDETNVFAFGIGTAVNRYLIEGIAHAGKGEPFVVTSSGFAKEKAEQFIEYINKPALTNISIDFGSNDVYDLSAERIPDVFANRPVTVVGKYRGELTDDIQLTGYAASSPYIATASTSGKTEDLTALRFLWARDRVKNLIDYHAPTKARRQEVLSLGLKYSLLTEYTSFVAVDAEVVNGNQTLTSIKQPLPLPAGVSNSAVGGRINTTGAVSRAAGTNSIVDILIPGKSINFANDRFVLRWKPLVEGPYTVTVKNIFDDMIYSAETEDSAIWLDINDFKANPSGMFIITVSAAGHEERSEDYGFKHLPGSVSQLLPQPTDQRAVAFYTNLALQYDAQGLIVDAMSACEMGMEHYPDDEELKELYDRILINNGIGKF